MVNPSSLRVGARVLVPWGLDEHVPAEIVDVWGDPPTQVRVQLLLEDTEGEEPIVILLTPNVLDAA